MGSLGSGCASLAINPPRRLVHLALLRPPLRSGGPRAGGRRCWHCGFRPRSENEISYFWTQESGPPSSPNTPAGRLGSLQAERNRKSPQFLTLSIYVFVSLLACQRYWLCGHFYLDHHQWGIDSTLSFAFFMWNICFPSWHSISSDFLFLRQF